MSTKTLLTQGVNNKPIQFAVAGILLGTAGYFLIKKAGRDIIPNAEDIAKKNALDVSKDNPFSFAQFMDQPFPDGTPLIRVATAQANAKQVYDALSSILFDSPDMVIGLFNSYKNKAQVAQMCQAFYIAYKRDILTFLKNGNKVIDFGTGGLSTTDYNRIVTLVNKKPKF